MLHYAKRLKRMKLHFPKSIIMFIDMCITVTYQDRLSVYLHGNLLHYNIQGWVCKICIQ